MAASLALFLLPVGPAGAKPPGVITYAGGDGSSLEKSVVIKGATEESGVRAEYAYLAKHFPGYKRDNQGVMSKGKRTYDMLDFTTAAGEKTKIYFDITDFFGKLD